MLGHCCDLEVRCAGRGYSLQVCSDIVLEGFRIKYLYVLVAPEFIPHQYPMRKEEPREVNVRYQHTKNILCAFARLALVFLLPRVISFSASRWASLALGQVVFMDSWVMREVTRLRRRAWR